MGIMRRLKGVLSIVALGTMVVSASVVYAQDSPSSQPPAQEGSPVVELKTSMGDIVVELNAEKAPITVENFLKYVNDGFFDGTIFHRVIKDFMIQVGGFTEDMNKKETRPPIKNEAENGLKNERGTLAMARTQVVDSATAQFFINLKDNDFLNNGVKGFGYAVFGKVIEGMDVVDKIGAVKTTVRSGMRDVPETVILLENASVRKSAGEEE